MEIETLYSDLMDAMHALHKARLAAREERPVRLEVVQREITAAETSITRALGLIPMEPQG